MKRIILSIGIGIALLTTQIELCHGQSPLRVNAFYYMSYDGSQFVKDSDSSHVYFHGDHSYATAEGEDGVLGVDLPEYFIRIFGEEPLLPSYPNVYSTVSLSCDSSFNYELNPTTLEFDLLSSRQFGFADDNGNITELITRDWIESNWVNSYKEVITYNSNNKISEKIKQVWISGSWTNSKREVSEYNSEGELVAFTSFSWFSGLWYGTNKYIYEYDVMGNCISSTHQGMVDGSWANFDRSLITYNGNNPIELIDQTWGDEDWYDDYRVLISYNGNGNILNFTLSEFIEDEWSNYYRVTYSYSGDNKTECLQEEFDNFVWNKVMKSRYVYLPNGHMDYVYLQIWDDPNFEWINIQKLKVGYNEQQVIGSLTSESWNPEGSWELTDESMKYVFFYDSFIVTEIPKQEDGMKVNVFPNPATDLLNVSVDCNESHPASFVVYDINGRLWMTQQIGKEKFFFKTLDLSKLPNGNYFLTIYSDKTKVTKPFCIAK